MARRAKKRTTTPPPQSEDRIRALGTATSAADLNAFDEEFKTYIASLSTTRVAIPMLCDGLKKLDAVLNNDSALRSIGQIETSAARLSSIEAKFYAWGHFLVYLFNADAASHEIEAKAREFGVEGDWETINLEDLFRHFRASLLSESTRIAILATNATNSVIQVEAQERFFDIAKTALSLRAIQIDFGKFEPFGKSQKPSFINLFSILSSETGLMAPPSSSGTDADILEFSGNSPPLSVIIPYRENNKGAIRPENLDDEKPEHADHISPVFEGTLDRDFAVEALKLAHQQSGLSQRKFAEQLGVDPKDIRQALNGERTIDWTLEQIEKAGFSVDVSAKLTPIE